MLADGLHQRAEERSLALHRLVADRLREDPRTAEDRERLHRMIEADCARGADR